MSTPKRSLLWPLLLLLCRRRTSGGFTSCTGRTAERSRYLKRFDVHYFIRKSKRNGGYCDLGGNGDAWDNMREDILAAFSPLELFLQVKVPQTIHCHGFMN